MKERPIIFSTEMVKAILEGRKTQTRRVIKKQPAGEWAAPGKSQCPYGQSGDRLWVRETFSEIVFPGGEAFLPRLKILYRADGEYDDCMRSKWKPSIHMPRKYSRILLEITNVRVERLQDISEIDAGWEGTPNYNKYPSGVSVDDFRHLWDSINEKRGYGWDQNPWVWVIEFKRVS